MLDTKASFATRAFGTPDVCTAHARNPGSAIVWRAGEDSSVTKVTITSHSNQHHNAITDNKITLFHSNLSANITSQLQLQYFSQLFYDYKICRSSSLSEKMAISIENPTQRRLVSPVFTVSSSPVVHNCREISWLYCGLLVIINDRDVV